MASEFKTIDPNDLTTPERQWILNSAVAPRPIAFASTIDADGNVNLSPFSFFNVFSNNPPVLVFSPSRRGRDNTTKHTYENVLEVPEVSINIVNYPMAEQMSLASTEYDKGVNEFVKAGFTEIPSDIIRPPRVAESPVSFECVVDKVIPLGDQGGAGNLVISIVKKIHINTQYLDENGKLDTTKIDLIARMGANYYARAFGDAIFEIPKPLQKLGIGVDQLPEHIRNSSVLTANNLGRLGNIEQLPSPDEIASRRSDPGIADIFDRFNGEELTHSIHTLARELLEAGELETALTTLCTLDHE